MGEKKEKQLIEVDEHIIMIPDQKIMIGVTDLHLVISHAKRSILQYSLLGDHSSILPTTWALALPSLDSPHKQYTYNGGK